jgi:type II secretory pathway pseudopilin PulG
MIVVAIIGLLASVAIPAYLSYIKESRTSEARHNLQGLFKRVEIYITNEHPDPATGEVYSMVIPDSTGPSPGATCCVISGSPKCAPDGAYWTGPTWKAIGFRMSKGHFYQYEINKISDTQFSVVAYSDLDCDGTLSTYTLAGEIKDGKVLSSGTIQKKRPLE